MITDKTGAQAFMHAADEDHLPSNDRHHR
jgi:hypothetical protein